MRGNVTVIRLHTVKDIRRRPSQSKFEISMIAEFVEFTPTS